MTDVAQPMQSALALLLEERLIAWEQARKPQELKMLECYQDVMRIAREDDTSGTGAARAKKAKALFIGSTRNKVRSARAKINDALFGAGQLPFDTSPTNEELAPFSDAVEDILTEQLQKMGFKAMLKAGVNTLATYGTGFIFGPFVRKESITETNADNSAGFTQLQETKYEYDCPYFELANSGDVYPDPEARDIADGLGCFWTTFECPHTVAAWKADKRFRNIDEALVNKGGAGETGSDRATQLRGAVNYWHQNDRIKVARFFGKVPKPMIEDGASATDVSEDQAEGETDSESLDSSEMVDVIVIMAGGVVVKVDRSPYGKTPTLRAVYEAVEHEIWGVGVAENNAPHQKVTNAAFRLFMEGKGMALLGTASVDRSKFLPTEDFRKFPGKVYQMKPGLSPEERQTAIIQHTEADITGGWLDVIRMSEGFSDDDTGITKYTQGDDSRNLNKTASGISMIMSASSLPIKEVIQNIDEMWIEPIVEALIDWDLKYLEVETVQKIHGDKIAQIWQQIKQFGKSSFMDWQATGTSSFMQKEVLTSKLRAFAEFALSNPATASLIDARELLTQTWDVMEIGRESPILEDQNKAKIPPQVHQAMQQMQEQMQAMDQQMSAAADKIEELQSEQEMKVKELTVKAYEAETKRITALGSGMTPEQVQALVMQTVMAAMQTPAPGPQIQEDAQEYEQQEQFPQIEPAPPDPQMQEQPQEPASAGFSLPEA